VRHAGTARYHGSSLSRLAPAPVEQKDRVKSFWEEEPCGVVHAEAPEGTREFFAQIERTRNELEPFIPEFADFAGAEGKVVLEIGVGAGTDFIRFVRAGAVATGVDLTEHAVELVRRRVELEGFRAELLTADAEALPFEDATFDRVYSWGVLHHTPDTERSVQEAIRVLRPGGDICVMLYARHSWVAYGLWVRHALLAGKPRRSLADVLSTHMESEGTKGFTKSELREIFAGLQDLRIDKIGTAYDRQISRGLSRLTGDRFGWFLVARGRKAS
jgi:ubiquinone/menaquinone biosynthesis C-methylase UbiE